MNTNSSINVFPDSWPPHLYSLSLSVNTLSCQNAVSPRCMIAVKIVLQVSVSSQQQSLIYCYFHPDWEVRLQRPLYTPLLAVCLQFATHWIFVLLFTDDLQSLLSCWQFLTVTFTYTFTSSRNTSSLPSTLLTGALEGVSIVFKSFTDTCKIVEENLINQSVNKMGTSSRALKERRGTRGLWSITTLKEVPSR